jgi:rhodanese-related sulfurtransferase
MIYFALVLLGILSLYNIIALKNIRKRLEEVKDSIHSQVSWAKEDLRSDITGMKVVLKIMAAGGKVTSDMVDEGKPYSDISAADAMKFLQQHPDTVILDVRTSSEFQAGHIPGAKLLPVDELENRLAEVPKEVQNLLVTCQGGGRSAAACNYLSEKGYTNLLNMYDGMGGWPGQKEIGASIRPPAPSEQNG